MSIKKSITPIILAGGSGQRLRPLTNKKTPKPFVSFLRKRSLLQNTLDRLAPFAPPIIVAHEQTRGLCAQHIRENNTQIGDLLLEPLQCGTAAAVIAACYYLSEKYGNSMVLISPVDHDIKDKAAFHDTIRNAAQNLENNQIALFGIPPKSASAQYGYISHDQNNAVTAFHEKPAAGFARGLIQQGNSLWNTGYVLMDTKTCLDAAQKLCPDLYLNTVNAVTRAGRVQNAALFNAESYSKIDPLSFDKAILEHADNLVIHRLNTGWQDIGTLYSYFKALLT